MSVDNKPTPPHSMLENLLEHANTQISDMGNCMGALSLFEPDEQDELAQTEAVGVTKDGGGTIFGTAGPQMPLLT
jgi:hypothetical protein